MCTLKCGSSPNVFRKLITVIESAKPHTAETFSPNPQNCYRFNVTVT